MATVSEANHDLCVKPVTNKLEAEFRFELEVERHGDKYYSEMASENHMDRLQVEVVKLNDELAEILNEADYMKEKEVKSGNPGFFQSSHPLGPRAVATRRLADPST
ncbi:hypothetical protein JL720_10021 [Aureococcus anophagefferens]|nr:hypothetical protein JL720_10021 [Aureococcus anophagefferens]